jgi:predicted GNAT family N-acyltransferase
MINYSPAGSKDDLKGILALQKANLTVNLASEEISSQGFVTVDHTYDQLSNLNDQEKHIIAKDNEKVIGYVLAMTEKSKSDIPILIPMFNIFRQINFNGKTIAKHNYIVVGQVCINKSYRGKGIFDNCYAAYREHYKDKYEFAITEIAKTNHRSLNAHKRVGFKEIYNYTTSDNVEWVIVLWDWKNGCSQATV